MSIWFHTPGLEALNHPPTPNAATLMGVEFTEIGADFLRARMPVDSRTHQPFGLLHGGCSVVLAESMGSLGAWMCIDPERYAAVGIEVNANHVRGIRSGWVYGEARPLHRGRNTHVWDIRITDERERLICVSRLTVAIVPAR